MGPSREAYLKRDLLLDWDQIAGRAKRGIAKLGRDIPITTHSQESDMAEYRKDRAARRG